MSFYQRQRGKYQQAPTKDPCFYCAELPAESCHLLPWLDLVKSGFPAEVISQDWNIVPLCRPCHWLYDNREDIWVGNMLKQSTLSGKVDAIKDNFIALLDERGITVLSDRDDWPEDLPEGMRWVGSIYDLGWVQGDYDILVTKLFTLPCKSLESEEVFERLKALWSGLVKHTGALPRNEYRELAGKLQKEFRVKREDLLTRLAERRANAEAKAKGLAKSHLLWVELKIGNQWDKNLIITQFNLDHLRQDGAIKVLLWKKEGAELSNALIELSYQLGNKKEPLPLPLDGEPILKRRSSCSVAELVEQLESGGRLMKQEWHNGEQVVVSVTPKETQETIEWLKSLKKEPPTQEEQVMNNEITLDPVTKRFTQGGK